MSLLSLSFSLCLCLSVPLLSLNPPLSPSMPRERERRDGGTKMPGTNRDRRRLLFPLPFFSLFIYSLLPNFCPDIFPISALTFFMWVGKGGSDLMGSWEADGLETNGGFFWLDRGWVSALGGGSWWRLWFQWWLFQPWAVEDDADVEDEAAKISMEEQTHLTTIQTTKKVLISGSVIFSYCSFSILFHLIAVDEQTPISY